MLNLLDILTTSMQQVLIAVAVGGLVGLKIERGRERFIAGVRTLTLISLFGMFAGRLMIVTGRAEVLYAFTAVLLAIAITTFLHGFKVIFPMTVRLRLPLSMIFVFFLGAIVGIGQFVIASVGSIALAFAILEKRRISEVLSKYAGRS